MKKQPILFATTAAAAVLAVAIITHAAAPDTTAPATSGAAPDATMAGPSTNAADDMTALFGDPVVASGTGISVKRSAIDEVATKVKAAYAEKGETITPDRLMLFEAQQLEQMIDLQLLLQKASDTDRAAGNKKADEAIAALLKQFGSQDELDMQLTAADTTEAKLRTKFSDEGTAIAALQRLLGISVTDAEVQKFYETHPQEFEVPEKVHVRWIRLLTADPATGEPLTDDVVQEKRKQADGIVARARAGEDFGKLAEEYSDDTATKFKGGDLPPFARASADPRDAMLPQLEEAAFSMTNNQVSDVVPTQYALYILQLVEKLPAKKLTLTDKVPSSETTVDEAVKEGLMQQKTSQMATPYMDQLKKAANVKILDPDLNAAMQQLAIAATNSAAATTGEQAAPAAPAN